jgi:uncharacterized protein (DUF362 family)
MKTRKRMLRLFFALILLVCWLAWDISQAEKDAELDFQFWKPASEVDAITDATAKVSIVRSDDAELPNPLSISDESIDYPEIEQMVRRAVELAGGLNWFINPGDMVLIKPNIVDPEKPGTGEVTDVRVVKALVKVVNDIDPGNMEIVVAEGSPRPMDYEMAYQTSRSKPSWEKLWDVCGYQDLLTDPELAGINLRLSNLNGSPADNPWEDLVEVDFPDAQALPQGGKYWIHQDVLNADAYITVPVMKIHTVGMTCALKNQIGLAPCTKYGFSKNSGVPQNGYTTKLTHHSLAPKHYTDKEIVDLSNLAGIDFVLVDAIACLELKKTAERKNGVITNFVRMNTILASPDPVATDHICCRLMGLNPDDMEQITLAERVGLGTNQADQITVVGATVESTAKRFKKTTANTGNYGQSNRDWIIRGPFSTEDIEDPIQHPFLENEAEVSPLPSQDGWSEAIYFTDDRIDLRSYFDKERRIVSYAFAYFDAPADQQAEFWLGSDEAMKIWLNGELVYDYNSTRTFSDDDFYLEKIKTNIKAGENRLLVKTLHKYGNYDFSLNICEPENNSNYDGNRIWGLKFNTTATGTRVTSDPVSVVSDFQLGDAYPNPFNHNVKIEMTLGTSENVVATVHNVQGQHVRTLVNQRLSEGQHVLAWDGRDENGFALPSGTFFINVKSGRVNELKKVTFVK